MFQRNSRGVILHGAEGEEEGEGPDGLRPGVADDDDGGQLAEAQAIDGGAERPPGPGEDGEPETARGVSPNSDGEFVDDATNAANNKYAACAFMKMNPDLLQALPASSSSPPLMIASGASGSVLGGSNTQEAEPAPLPEEEESHSIPPPLVRHRVEENSPRSPAMQPSPAEVTRPKGASVVPESPGNLEIDTLEIGGGSDELGFEDIVAGSDT